MVLTVIRPGPLATLQGRARQGLRHQGIPASFLQGLDTANLVGRVLGKMKIFNVHDIFMIRHYFGRPINDGNTKILEITIG